MDGAVIEAGSMSTEHDLASTDDLPLLRVRGPADLAEAVPFLLGFHPSESLVLIGLSDDRVVVTARMNLADLAVSALLGDTVAAICGGSASKLVCVVFDESAAPGSDDTLPWRGVITQAQDEATRLGLDVTDAMLVCGRRWWSYLCADAGCCPAEGQPLDTGASEVRAAATFAGLVALPNRASVEALLEPLPEARRMALQPRLEEAERAAVAAILDGKDAREQRSVKRAMFAASRTADALGPERLLSDDEVVRFGVALNCYAVRDSLWIAVDGGRLDGRELWRQLARRLPGPYAAAPLFLFGWANWRAGNGALAGMAAEQALRSDPAYTAADLLLGALSRGIDPRRMPKLRCARSA